MLGFFDVEKRLARLSGLGDQLEAFSPTLDFEAFRPDLDKALAYSDRSKGGRSPFDLVLMFHIMVIQTLNNLSDERTETLINDRLFSAITNLGCFHPATLSHPTVLTVLTNRRLLRP